MERDEIAKFKQSLKSELDQIDDQTACLGNRRKEVVATIESLSRMEALYFGNVAEPPIRREPAKTITVLPTGKVIVEKGPSTKTRIKEARKKISGKYQRMELYRKTIEDGKGEFSRGTYGWLFAELVKEGEIKVLQQSVGNQPAVYCNPEEYEKLKSESPENLGFNLLGDK